MAPTHLDKLLREGAGAKEFWIELNPSFPGPFNSDLRKYDAYNREMVQKEVPQLHVREVTPLDRAKDEIIEVMRKALERGQQHARDRLRWPDEARQASWEYQEKNQRQALEETAEIARKAWIEQEEGKKK